MDINIIEKLSVDQTVLLLISGTEYNDITLNLAKQLSGKKVAYVTLNKTCIALRDHFKKEGVGVENFVFIDGITKTIKNVPDMSDGCYYVSSPNALTEISITISKLLKHGFDYLVFDSLTNLLIYQEKAPVARFVSNAVAKIKSENGKALFYALSGGKQEALIQEAGMFVDRVVDLSKG